MHEPKRLESNLVELHQELPYQGEKFDYEYDFRTNLTPLCIKLLIQSFSFSLFSLKKKLKILIFWHGEAENFIKAQNATSYGCDFRTNLTPLCIKLLV